MTRGQKALVALVVAMGVLIVVGTTALLVVVVHRIAHPRPSPERPRPVAASAAPADLSGALREPDGTRVTAIAPDGPGELAIALSGGGLPDRVVLWSTDTGRRLGTITVGSVPAPSP